MHWWCMHACVNKVQNTLLHSNPTTHTYIHTDIHTQGGNSEVVLIHTYIQGGNLEVILIHIYIHTCIHTYTERKCRGHPHTYMHTYIHAYTGRKSRGHCRVFGVQVSQRWWWFPAKFGRTATETCKEQLMCVCERVCVCVCVWACIWVCGRMQRCVCVCVFTCIPYSSFSSSWSLIIVICALNLIKRHCRRSLAVCVIA